MDVKEINKTTVLAALTRGNTVMGGSMMVGDAFSRLLETQTTAPDFSKEVSFAPKENAKNDAASAVVSQTENKVKHPIEDREKSPVKEKREAGKTEQKTASRSEDRKNTKEKSVAADEVVENVEGDSSENAENRSAVLPDVGLLLTNVPQQAAELSDVVTVVENEAVATGIEAAAENEAMPVNLGEALVQPQMQEAVQTTPAKVQTPVTTENKMMSTADEGKIDISALQMTPENVPVEMAAVEVQGAELKAGDKKSVKNAVSDVNVADGNIMPEKIAEPSSGLEQADFGKNIKIETTLKEETEDFSYQKTADLIMTDFKTEDVPVDSKIETVKLADIVSGTGEESSQTLEREHGVSFQSTNTTSVRTNMVVPNTVAVNNPAETAVEIARENVVEVKNVQLAQAVGGSEFVNAAKANAADQLKSPVNDAYKGMGREVAEQVKVNITKSAVRGVDKIDITLKPQDLGHIEIKMHLAKDGKLQAEIVASRPETMEMLQKEAQNLQRSFEEAGFQTDENSLNFSCREDNTQSGQQERSYEMRRFIGEALDSDFSNDNLTGYAESSWDGQSGLNIRV